MADARQLPKVRWAWCYKKPDAGWRDFPSSESFDLQIARNRWVDHPRSAPLKFEIVEDDLTHSVDFAKNKLNSAPDGDTCDVMCRVVLPCEDADRWAVISECLKKVKEGHVKDIGDLIRTLATVSDFITEKMRLSSLVNYVEKCLREVKIYDVFFKNVLPFIAELALKMDTLPRIPMLLAQNKTSLELSSLECMIILAGSFFCMYPIIQRDTDFLTVPVPNINFLELYLPMHPNCFPSVAAKLHCMVNYFMSNASRAASEKGLIPRRLKFTRKVLDSSETTYDVDWWRKQNNNLTKVQIIEDRAVTIEHQLEGDGEAFAVYRMDFANKYLGGGTLGAHGCVQEEIMFAEHPECIVGQLFCEMLRKNESILIEGPERFSRHIGYAYSFTYKGHFHDHSPVTNGLRATKFVAMDALDFRNGGMDVQYREDLMLRELNKLYCTFRDESDSDAKDEAPNSSIVATGNWGCGAFLGDAQLKAMLQLIAAAAAEKHVRYHTFADKNMIHFDEVYKKLDELKVTAAELWILLIGYGQKRLKKSVMPQKKRTVFEHVLIQLAKHKRKMK